MNKYDEIKKINALQSKIKNTIELIDKQKQISTNKTNCSTNMKKVNEYTSDLNYMNTMLINKYRHKLNEHWQKLQRIKEITMKED